MTSVRYEAGTHRLRIEGPCRSDARHAIDDAFETFAPMAGDHLIVDLTGVTDIDETIASGLIAMAQRAAADGRKVTFVRKAGTTVDDALVAAEAELSWWR